VSSQCSAEASILIRMGDPVSSIDVVTGFKSPSATAWSIASWIAWAIVNNVPVYEASRSKTDLTTYKMGVVLTF